MNPCTTELNNLRDLYLGNNGFYLDIEPQRFPDGKRVDGGEYYVSLHDEDGNEVDTITFGDYDTGLRYIDWLVDNAHKIAAITNEEFKP